MRLVNPSLNHQGKQSWVLAGEMEYGISFTQQILGGWEVEESPSLTCRSNTIVKEFLIFPNRCKTMAQGVCDKVSSESLCTSLVKDKEIYGQGRSVISAWVWQFILGMASAWYFGWEISASCHSWDGPPGWSCLVLIKGVSITGLSLSWWPKVFFGASGEHYS